MCVCYRISVVLRSCIVYACMSVCLYVYMCVVCSVYCVCQCVSVCVCVSAPLSLHTQFSKRTLSFDSCEGMCVCDSYVRTCVCVRM